MEHVEPVSPPADTFQPFVSDERVAKLLGADVELGNFLEGTSFDRTGRAASRLLLRFVPGISSHYTFHAQDAHRKYLPETGGCAYIDLDHAEFPIPEVLRARDFVAVWHATLRIARQALQDANDRLVNGQKLRVLVNNSDGLGHSYGSHCNILITRRAFDNIFSRKLHHLLFLAAYQASSIVITGQGKVGTENGTPHVDYQISQRADFFETLHGIQTTHTRPIVNCRDEPLCGRVGTGDEPSARLARLHCIFFDANLCHVANFLKVGILQIIVAMLEAEQVDTRLLLDDPVAAVVGWSHDPALHTRMRLADGRHITAVDHQRLILDAAHRFADGGGCDGIVPDSSWILELWDQVLSQLACRDFPALAGSLDWILKRSMLERALTTRPDLNWDSPELKRLDHVYSSLDPAEGIYWAFERSGLARQIVSPGDVERYVYEAPADTRAWTRAQLLQLAGPERIDHIDWDQITFRFPGLYGFPKYETLWMPDPLGMTRRDTEHLFESGGSLMDIVESLRDMSSPGASPQRAVAANEPPERDSSSAGSLIVSPSPTNGDQT